MRVTKMDRERVKTHDISDSHQYRLFDEHMTSWADADADSNADVDADAGANADADADADAEQLSILKHFTTSYNMFAI